MCVLKSVILRQSAFCLLLVAALLPASLTRAAVTAESDYIGCVDTALAELEAGRADVALTQLKAALKWDANDPLAHAALGMCLLMGGRATEASAEFAQCGALDPHRAEAAYGQGLIKLREGRPGAAAEAFCKAQSLSPRVETEDAIRYAKIMAGGTNTSASGAGGELGRAMDALAAASGGEFDKAIEVWKHLDSGDAQSISEDHIGVCASFLPDRPLTVRGTPIKGKIDLPTAATFKGPKLSGTVSLRADLTKVKDVRMVAFLVDNRLAGLTNEAPYQFMWDTSRVPNGQHTIKVVGSDSAGCTVSEKTTVVHVQNHSSSAPQHGTATDAKVWNRLWALMELRPSRASVNYNLAACMRSAGDVEPARAALERVIAMDPGYRDAGHLLATMHQGPAIQGLHRVRTNQKLVALTFDDGPSADTSKLLDLLNEKGAKATFFVVGKQVEAHPETLRRIADEGHEIANHTFGHRALDLLTTSEIEQEIFRCAAAVRSVTGRQTVFLRPPGGRSGKRLEEVARRYGITTVFWTASCTSREGAKWEKMRDYIVASASPGAIILMHNTEGVTLRALPSAIDAMRAQGYQFATLSDLVARSDAGNGGSENGLVKKD
jgi:peptidoglycan/xylan/chitin deacetylase (PgdA/CDA1 family)